MPFLIPEIDRLLKASTEAAGAAFDVVSNAGTVDIDMPKDVRDGLPGYYYTLSGGHCEGILHLAQIQRFSPALALLRPAMEGLIRGLWIQYRASDAELEKIHIAKGIKFPDVPTMTAALNESNCPQDYAELVEHFGGQVFSFGHDFTHGGKVMAAIMVDDKNNTFTPNVPEQWRIDTIELATIIYLLASLATVHFLESEEGITQISEQLDRYGATTRREPLTKKGEPE